MSGSPREVLAEFNANLPRLQKAAPAVAKAFGGQLMPAVLQDGVLSTKQKELIALGMAVGAACDYCICIHIKKAYEAGCTREEIAEACGVAILMAGGPAFTYATFTMQAVEDLAP